ncbi:MAG: zinc-binding alcohol dehydrogenase [Anaerolineales bacterium]|nr:zinc-binding alcohol dehydrogenase [Anaerolineales bacterium]
MKRQSVTFTAPYAVEVRDAALPAPAAHQLLVATQVSAISPGTEMLVYRGQMPADLPLDATISALDGAFAYPLTYGYAAVGRVMACGTAVSPDWHDRLVFAFQPHASHFLATPDELIPVPDGLDAETAVLLPNMETAVSFLMDSQPLIGEQVAVFGQGIVGLLTTALLAQLPLARLVTADRHPLRRDWSTRLGAHASLDPAAPTAVADLLAELQQDRPYAGADLTFELSGHPAALDQAVAVTGYNGRVLIGSWYGTKPVNLNLGGRFHRSHMQLISSQVSHLAPRWHGRWTSARRLGVAWAQLARCQPARLITHRFPLAQAAAAYRLIDQQPEQTIQVLLTY